MEMNTYKELIGKYRKSDFGDRIFLFLEHRDLRAEFSAINMADAKRNREPATAKQKSTIPKLKWLNPIKRVWQEIFSTSKPSSNSVN